MLFLQYTQMNALTIISFKIFTWLTVISVSRISQWGGGVQTSISLPLLLPLAFLSTPSLHTLSTLRVSPP